MQAPDGLHATKGRRNSCVGEDPEILLDAIRATGASLWEAIGMIAGIPGGRALARHHWDVYLKTGPPGAGPATALKEVATASPRQARDLLRIWLKGRYIDADLELNDQRWVTEIPGPLSIEGDLSLLDCRNLRSLPAGLTVGGNLYIPACTRLRELPSGLRVGGNLWADFCRNLRTIPGDIVVEGDLAARGCPWDGVLPREARVVGRIHR